MVNTDTMDTEATVQQIKELDKAGCQLVRITAQGPREAENLKHIKDKLRAESCNVPLVADIHFSPKAADIAATIVEKVRINPGNYVNRKNSDTFDYTDKEYQEELQRIEEKFVNFLNICKKHKTAIRIGSNHGSLSDRIVSRYGNTPEGMVEAAMEFARICKKEDFTNVVISMKASNTQIMMQSNRWLVKKMRNEEIYYPIHLGVTEAGDSQEGRIKSSIGIGALLVDGIGDTIRVSLTESPIAEIPVANAIVKHYSSISDQKELPNIYNSKFNPYQFRKRKTFSVVNIGANNLPVVIIRDTDTTTKNLKTKADFIFVDNIKQVKEKELNYILPLSEYKEQKNIYPYFSWQTFKSKGVQNPKLNFVTCQFSDADDVIENKEDLRNVVFVLETERKHSLAEQRAFFFKIQSANLENPIIINKKYTNKDKDSILINSACDIGPLFIDALGEGIFITTPLSAKDNLSISLDILQGARIRMSKTEFISCPSCGRTLFDLEKTTAQIKKRLSHLKHLKVGVMGCIVNGPGEMADADYGYVGSGAKKITLYKGQEVIKRDIDSNKAVDILIEMIKENGDWKEE